MPRDPLDQTYGLIAAGRFTEAIHCVNKILRKQPNYLIAKVWKCEALHGLGNVAESEDLMNSIVEEGSSDKRTLESIAEYYRARGDYAKLVQVYEDALKHDPSDENWRKALFESCGLAGDYKKQHIQALYLYKTSSRMLFYGMAVVCLLQQESPVALAIAERMVNKQPEADSLKNKNEILLLINVYECNKKYEEALDLLVKSESELEEIICCLDKKIQLLEKLGRWNNVISLLKTYLTNNANSWSHYDVYLRAVQKEAESVEESFKFFSFLEDNNPTLRGPFLATLKLTAIAGKPLLALLANYFLKFGDKSICVFDIKHYLSQLPQESTKCHVEQICGVEFEKLHLEKVQLERAKHVSFVQISKVLGLFDDLSSNELEAHCEDLLRCYKLAADCDRKDQYLVMLAQTSLQLFTSTGQAKHLVCAISILETCIETGQAAFAIHVLLLQLYFALGATKSARKLYEQLRIQSVQVDTLSHLLLTNIASTGHFSIAFEMWEGALKILQHCVAESTEALVWCYRSGLYHRVAEFTRCAQRFSQTVTVPLLVVEKAYLDVVVAEPGRVEQLLLRSRNRVAWDQCIDNRDFSALPTWNPPSKTCSVDSFRELILYGKLRESTLFCTLAAIQFAKSREEQKKYLASFDELQSYYSEGQILVGEQRQRPGCTPASRLSFIVSLPLPHILNKILEGDAAEKVSATLEQCTKDCLERVGINANCNPRFCLETVVSLVEFLGIATVVCGAARSNQPPPQKRRNEQIVRVLESSWNLVESCLVTIQNASVVTDAAFEAKLQENYSAAVEDLKKLIRKKLTYLHKLK